MKHNSANPKKNADWREVYQQRVESLESKVKEWEKLDSVGELSEVEKKALLLRKEALAIGKIVTNYHNYIDDDAVRWQKGEGFMAGKSVSIDGDDAFWIFKSPGEIRVDNGKNYPNYLYKDRQNIVDKTREHKLHNISYSRGFMEVYSLAEIMMPDHIMQFAVAQKLKYPDQFFVATRFIDNAKPLDEESLTNSSDIADQFKNIRLIGSIIGFDDMIYPNILLGEGQRLLVIDGIDPIDNDNNKRRNFFSLISRNFFELKGMFGTRVVNEEGLDQSKLEDLKRKVPQLVLRFRDLQKLVSLVEEKQDILSEFFTKIEPFKDVESLSIQEYFERNFDQLKCLISVISHNEPDYEITSEDLEKARKIYERPSTSVEVREKEQDLRDKSHSVKLA